MMLDASIEAGLDVFMGNVMAFGRAKAEVSCRVKERLMRISCCKKVDSTVSFD